MVSSPARLWGAPKRLSAGRIEVIVDTVAERSISATAPPSGSRRIAPATRRGSTRSQGMKPDDAIRELSPAIHQAASTRAPVTRSITFVNSNSSANPQGMKNTGIAKMSASVIKETGAVEIPLRPAGSRREGREREREWLTGSRRRAGEGYGRRVADGLEYASCALGGEAPSCYPTMERL